MSIDSKHAYRFKYLKSDKWAIVRLEALVREKGKCQICGEESISNDAHHVWYPESVWDTKEHHLAVLCRPCHEFLHAIMPECKTNDRHEGRAHWFKFRNAIMHWRTVKFRLFESIEGVKLTDPKQLRDELKRVKAQLVECEKQLAEYRDLI